MPINVMADLEMPRLEERELQPLTPAEELRLLEAHNETDPPECRNKAIFLLMLSTGIRKGELIGLKDEAVNLEKGFITVFGKGKRQRSVPFGLKTAWVLQCHCYTQPGEPGSAIEHWGLRPQTPRKCPRERRSEAEQISSALVHCRRNSRYLPR